MLVCGTRKIYEMTECRASRLPFHPLIKREYRRLGRDVFGPGPLRSFPLLPGGQGQESGQKDPGEVVAAPSPAALEEHHLLAVTQRTFFFTINSPGLRYSMAN